MIRSGKPASGNLVLRREWRQHLLFLYTMFPSGGVASVGPRRRGPHALSGAASWTSAGAPGLAVPNSSGSYVQIQEAGPPILAGRSQCTVLAVVRTTTGLIDGGGSSCYAERPDATSIFKLDSRDGLSSVGCFFTLRDAGGNLLQVRDATTICDGVMHCYAGRLDSPSSASLFVDGELRGSGSNGSMNMVNFPTSTPIMIGNDPQTPSTAMFAGDILLLAGWSVALPDLARITRAPWTALFGIRPPPRRTTFVVASGGSVLLRRLAAEGLYVGSAM